MAMIENGKSKRVRRKLLQEPKLKKVVKSVTQPYRQVFHELSIADGIVLRGDRIVVPEKLRHRMAEIAHEGHQGQV